MRSMGSPLSALARATFPCWVKISPAAVSWRRASRAIGFDTPNSLAISPSGGKGSPGESGHQRVLRQSHRRRHQPTGWTGGLGCENRFLVRVGCHFHPRIDQVSTAAYNLATKFISCQVIQYSVRTHQPKLSSANGSSNNQWKPQTLSFPDDTHSRRDRPSAHPDSAQTDGHVLGRIQQVSIVLVEIRTDRGHVGVGETLARFSPKAYAELIETR